MQTIGEKLEEARKQKGITIREAAEVTKIRGEFLAHFENNHFDINLPEIYARGFVKQYAKFLGLDPEQIGVEYNALRMGGLRVSSRRDLPTGNNSRASLGRIEVEDEESSASSPAQASQSRGSSGASPIKQWFGQIPFTAKNDPSHGEDDAPTELPVLGFDKSIYWKAAAVVGISAAIVVFLVLLVGMVLNSGSSDDSTAGQHGTQTTAQATFPQTLRFLSIPVSGNDENRSSVLIQDASGQRSPTLSVTPKNPRVYEIVSPVTISYFIRGGELSLALPNGREVRIPGPTGTLEYDGAEVYQLRGGQRSAPLR